ncbi:hypothetical protein [Acidicapsa acidisoli]|uniref:hypothetical protein n=1 Tax=Acidicapsa acidisoli TaxID=1615681 RepID=UPI0021E0A2D1|nr:hypothetical protein [Acidicapsa acidisoli]
MALILMCLQPVVGIVALVNALNAISAAQVFPIGVIAVVDGPHEITDEFALLMGMEIVVYLDGGADAHARAAFFSDRKPQRRHFFRPPLPFLIFVRPHFLHVAIISSYNSPAIRE